MTRVAFKLTMPGRASWNGAWSGADRNFVIMHNLDDAVAVQIDGRSWSYAWSDGWCACVHARVVAPGEHLAKSDGFGGYDWMIDSILQHDKIYASGECPKEASS